jgi:hypothetical protein
VFRMPVVFVAAIPSVSRALSSPENSAPTNIF